jgi:hypothetical protein
VRLSFLALLVGVSLLSSAQTANGQVIVRHNGSTIPLSEGWSTYGSGLGRISDGPIDDGGIPAWFIYDDDAIVNGSTLGYQITPTASDLMTAGNRGWALSARLRVVDVNDTPDYSVFVEFANGYRRYIMSFGSDAAGSPIVRLSTDGGFLVHSLPGSGSTYHLYELAFVPAMGSAVLLVDGVITVTGYTGMSGNLTRVAWGGGQSSSTGRAHYNLVAFQTGFTLPDADGDGISTSWTTARR